MARVLFVCLHNAGRSKMSEARFAEAAEGRHEVESAGTTPGEHVHPQVVEVMGEKGIDLEGRRPRRLDRAAAERADGVITMGCGDECPYIPGKRYIDCRRGRRGLPRRACLRIVQVPIAGRVKDLIRNLAAG